mgnify:CR=1 FL=1
MLFRSFLLLRVLGVEEEKAKEIALAIVDWRDPDLVSGPNPAVRESEYYASKQLEESHGRRREGPPVYMSKNDNFTTLEELLDVYGVTPELFFGKETRRSRKSRIQASARDRVQRPEGGTVGQRRGLRDFLTVWSDGSINVNTAPVEVLAAIAAGAGRAPEDAIGLAETAVSQRGGDRPDTNNAFRQLADFQKNTGFPAVGQSGARLTVISTTFQITALGTVRPSKDARPIEHSVRVVVRRQADRYPVNPLVDDMRGIWKDLPPGAPYYKKIRVRPAEPNTTYDPVIRPLQWVEW